MTTTTTKRSSKSRGRCSGWCGRAGGVGRRARSLSLLYISSLALAYSHFAQVDSCALLAPLLACAHSFSLSLSVTSPVSLSLSRALRRSLSCCRGYGARTTSALNRQSPDRWTEFSLSIARAAFSPPLSYIRSLARSLVVPFAVLAPPPLSTINPPLPFSIYTVAMRERGMGCT